MMKNMDGAGNSTQFENESEDVQKWQKNSSKNN